MLASKTLKLVFGPSKCQIQKVFPYVLASNYLSSSSVVVASVHQFQLAVRSCVQDGLRARPPKTHDWPEQKECECGWKVNETTTQQVRWRQVFHLSESQSGLQQPVGQRLATEAQATTEAIACLARTSPVVGVKEREAAR